MADSQLAKLERLRALIADARQIVAAHLPMKSINEIVREYTDWIERLIVDTVNGTVSSRAFASQLRSAIIENGRAVYLEGMREGGIKDPESELDSADEAAINEWILTQARAINGLRDDVLDAAKLTGDERTAARNALLERAQMWIRSLESLGGIGYASAKANQPGTWRLGKTEEHCDTCAELNGQRHRLKWFTGKGYIPRQPGSAMLECGGYNCDCQIVDDNGKRIL